MKVQSKHAQIMRPSTWVWSPLDRDLIEMPWRVVETLHGWQTGSTAPWAQQPMWSARDGVIPADVGYFATAVLIPRMQHCGELDLMLPAQEQFISYDTLQAQMREDNPGCQRPGFELRHQLEVLGYRVADIPAPVPPDWYLAASQKAASTAARLAAALPGFEQVDGAVGIRLFSVAVQLYIQRSWTSTPSH
ncbi:hypothetical protein WJX73_003374 [Symbiochloris irregularis]|uniref:Uncharacterized protein n=1 Tax=Symbiochloris irregularis TaxID=706552 RepID=A0AAW1P6L0_9CHLO